MATKRIGMNAITSREVLEGNLKSVMRLILALAAHYKPRSVRHHENTTISATNHIPTTGSYRTNHSGTYENVVSKSQTNGMPRKYEGNINLVYIIRHS